MKPVVSNGAFFASRRAGVRALSFSWLVLAFAGCEAGSATRQGASSAALAATAAPVAPSSAAAPALGSASALVVPRVSAEEVQKVVNPERLPNYSGATGSVVGVVKMTGDRAPTLEKVLGQLPRDSCVDARSMYGVLFREGSGRTLADALVAVTGYSGFVAQRQDAVRVTSHACAFQTRTAALTYGQQLEVANRGVDTVTPQLVGTKAPALLVALPGGAPVPMYVPGPGQFTLIDRTHPFAQIDVFVLAYPTFDVTELDGAFEIKGIPVGEVIVSALLPVIGAKTQARVQVEADKAAQVVLELSYDAKTQGPN